MVTQNDVINAMLCSAQYALNVAGIWVALDTLSGVWNRREQIIYLW